MFGDKTKLSSIFRSLHHRNFFLFFSGQGISLIGTWMQRIAMSWLVYRMTNSAFLLGFVGFASQFPIFVIAPLAGVLADHLNRRRILIITQALAMIQAFLLAFLVLTDKIEIWQVILLGALLGIVNAFDTPVRQSFVIDMVENKADLGNAIALNSSLVNAARLLGPSIAGILISLVGEGMCFLFNGVSYLAVILALLAMNIPLEKATQQSSDSIWDNLREGISYAFKSPPIRSILLLVALISLTGTSATVLMPVFAIQVLHGGPHTLGFLMASTGVGALFGAFFLASRPTAAGLGRWIFLAAGIFGIGLITFALTRLFAISIIVLIFTGFGMMVQMAASNTVLQLIVEDDKRGRVMSLYTMSFIGMSPFGSLLAGSLAYVLGPVNTLIIGGLCCITGSLLYAFYYRQPRFKKL
jgi:MFS family permease